MVELQMCRKILFHPFFKKGKVFRAKLPLHMEVLLSC